MAKDGIDRAKYRPLRQSKLDRRIEAIAKFNGVTSREALTAALRRTRDEVEMDILRTRLARLDARRKEGRQ